jgi:hypothetical protein
MNTNIADTVNSNPLAGTTKSVPVAMLVTPRDNFSVDFNPTEELGSAPLGSTARDRTDMQRMGKIQELKVRCFVAVKA